MGVVCRETDVSQDEDLYSTKIVGGSRRLPGIRQPPRRIHSRPARGYGAFFFFLIHLDETVDRSVLGSVDHLFEIPA